MINLIKILLEEGKVLPTNDYFYDIIKRKKELSAYFKDNYNWSLYEDNNLIKLKKIPSPSKAHIGSSIFKNKKEYSIYVALLISLEDYKQNNTFSFSQIFTKLKINLDKIMDLTWEDKTNRSLLKKVFQYAEENQILKRVNFKEKTEIDTNESNVDEVKVLYKKTEYCNYNYLINTFEQNIFSFNSVKDFEELQNNLSPKITLMRKLITNPVVYSSDLNYEEQEIIKNKRFIRFMEEKLNAELHVHKDSVFLFFKDIEIGTFFPKSNNSKSINAIDNMVLILNGILKAKVKNGEIILNKDETFYLEKEKFKKLVINYIEENKELLPKSIKEKNDIEEVVFNKVVETMKDWLFLKEDNDKLIFYPAIGKVTGYFKKEEIIEENKIEDQKLF